MTKTHYPYIDVLRVLGVVAVVYIHTTANALNPSHLDFFTLWANGLWHWAVPLFFMISGAVHTKPQPLAKMLGRCFNFIALFLLFGVVGVMLQVLGLQGALSTQALGLKDMLYKVFSNTDYRWFLLAMAGLSLSFPLLQAVMQNPKHLKTALLVLFGFGVVPYALSLVPKFFAVQALAEGMGVLSTYWQAVFYVFLGAFLHGFNAEKLKQHRAFLPLILVCTLLLHATLYAVLGLKFGTIQRQYMHYFSPFIVAESACLFLTAKAFATSFKAVVAPVAKCSLFMYLWHLPVLLWVFSLAPSTPLALFCLVPLATFVLSFLLALLTQKLWEKLWAKLWGKVCQKFHLA